MILQVVAPRLNGFFGQFPPRKLSISLHCDLCDKRESSSALKNFLHQHVDAQGGSASSSTTSRSYELTTASNSIPATAVSGSTNPRGCRPAHAVAIHVNARLFARRRPRWFDDSSVSIQHQQRRQLSARESDSLVDARSGSTILQRQFEINNAVKSTSVKTRGTDLPSHQRHQRTNDFVDLSATHLKPGTQRKGQIFP